MMIGRGKTKFLAMVMRKPKERTMSKKQKIDGPLISEAAAAEMLGLRQDVVHDLRERILKKGGRHYLLDEGVMKITPDGMLALRDAVLKTAEKKGVPAEVPEAVFRDLVVEGVVPNPRIVMAHLDGDEGKKVRVRVRSNRLFCRGMKMTGARMVSETLYAWEGRAPRSRGRW
jgi:hypothetical protein